MFSGPHEDLKPLQNYRSSPPLHDGLSE
ncbi:hypothetical protein NPIL_496181, partial [Nephila pilipes]